MVGGKESFDHDLLFPNIKTSHNNSMLTPLHQRHSSRNTNLITDLQTSSKSTRTACKRNRRPPINSCREGTSEFNLESVSFANIHVIESFLLLGPSTDILVIIPTFNLRLTCIL